MSLPLPTESVARVLHALQEKGLIGAWAVGGAAAVVYHAEPIATADMDVFTHLPQSAGGLVSLSPIYAELNRLGYQPRADAVVIAGIPVQILPAATPLHEEAIREAIEVRAGKETLRVFTPEHLVAIALQLGRAKDKLRIHHLLESSRSRLDLAKLDAILRRHGLQDRWAAFRTDDG